LRSGCFSGCSSRSSVSFEMDSEWHVSNQMTLILYLSHQLEFLVMFKFFVCHVSHPAAHFHRFHSWWILNWHASNQKFYWRYWLIWITIPCHIQFLCSLCFIGCRRLLLISFEIGSESASLGSETFCSCSSLESITISQTVQFIDGSPFSDVSNV
jgi:hypothetical protein